MQKLYEVICQIPKDGGFIYARLQVKNRFTWKTKRIAEKHAREYKALHLRDSWVSEA